MQAIEDELSRTAFNLFEQRGYNPGSALEDWLGAEASLLQPVTVSIADKDNQITVKAEVHGFSPGQLKVSVDGNMLSNCGKDEQSQKDTKTGGESAQTSSSTRTIHFKVALPSNVDSKRASATLDKGVLTLTLPKLDTSTKIEVKAA
jgi:HSP20 family protein